MTISKIMSATPEEFLRSLAHLRPHQTFCATESVFTIPLGEGCVTIALQRLPDRQVTGLLSLPQLEISIVFETVSSDQQEKFMEEFDQAFRRGGG